MTDSSRSERLPWLAALFALLLSAAVRWPALSLPIEGDAVAYGALARSLAHGDGYTIDGAPHDRYPPAYPAVVSLSIRGGASVTDAVRKTGLWLGVLVAPLTVLLGARLARGRISGWLLGSLASVHPALVLFAGGLVPGSESLALDLVLAALFLLSGRTRTSRALGLLLAACAPLARYDAIPFTLAAIALLIARRPPRASFAASAAGIASVALLPIVAWCVRNAVVAGSPFGGGYAAHAVSVARLPGNLLVLAALVLPAAGLVALWLFAPRGIRALWTEPSDSHAVGRAALLASGAHLVLIALFAGPTFSGDGAMAFSSGSLRFGLLATPIVLIAACVGLASRPTGWGRLVAGAALSGSLAVSVLVVSGDVQRRLPFRPLAAGRLDLLVESYRAAVAEARESDWIALDLKPTANAGVEIFLSDLGPLGHRVGVVEATEIPRGLFPRADVLPLAAELLADRRVVLLTDRPVAEGPIYTAGGQGIFHRIELRPPLGRVGLDPIFSFHQVRRTGK